MLAEKNPASARDKKSSGIDLSTPLKTSPVMIYDITFPPSPNNKIGFLP
jgi:hypothetical protein